VTAGPENFGGNDLFPALVFPGLEVGFLVIAVLSEGAVNGRSPAVDCDVAVDDDDDVEVRGIVDVVVDGVVEVLNVVVVGGAVVGGT
jgi:hypothetical protein